jgi:PAS domain S-box-containing protein
MPALDYFIYSAGVIALDPLENASVEDFDRQFATNVRGCFVLTKEMLPLLRSSLGQVLLINSTAGIRATGNAGQYAVTKHGLRAFADSLREEVNDSGIRVQSVFLGRTATPMQEAIHQMEGKEYAPDHLIQPYEVAELLVNILGLVQSAEVTDISIRPMRKPKPLTVQDPETILLRDADGTIRFWNEGAERMYGWRPEESLGQSSHHLLRTRFPKPLELILEELFEKGSWQGELLHTRRDGTKLAVNSRWELQRGASDEQVRVLERNVRMRGFAVPGFWAMAETAAALL